MNALANYIQSNNLTGTPAKIVADMDAEVVLSRDTTSYSLSGLASQLAAHAVDPMILVSLRSHIRTLPIGGDTLEGFLIAGGGQSGGVDCSRADIRKQIEINQGHPSTTVEQQAILAAMLLIGITTGKRYAQAGFDALPTEEQVAVAQSQIAVQRWVDDAANLMSSLAAGGESSIADIKAAVAAFEG